MYTENNTPISVHYTAVQANSMLDSIILFWHLIRIIYVFHGVHRPFIEYELIIHSIFLFVKPFFEISLNCYFFRKRFITAIGQGSLDITLPGRSIFFIKQNSGSTRKKCQLL